MEMRSFVGQGRQAGRQRAIPSRTRQDRTVVEMWRNGDLVGRTGQARWKECCVFECLECFSEEVASKVHTRESRRWEEWEAASTVGG